MDILGNLGISGSKPAPAFGGNKNKVNMYEAEHIKAKEIDIDSFNKKGKTFAVHMFEGNENVEDVKLKITKIANKLKDLGYVFRCDAGEADELGNTVAGLEGLKTEVYLPYKKFNINLSENAILSNTYELPYRYAATVFGEKYNNIKPGGRAVFASKMMSLLGKEGDNPVDFLLCYSPDGSEYFSGKDSGGNRTKIDFSKVGSLSFYIKACQRAGIPVFNIKNTESLTNFVESYLRPTEEAKVPVEEPAPVVESNLIDDL